MTPHTFPSPTPITWATLTREQRIAACTTLAAMGRTSTEMADELNATRNQVISCCARNNITLQGGRTYAAKPVDIGPDGGTDPALWQGEGVPWPATRKQCRWPLGELADRCCGAPRVRGSYCEHHAAIAYLPANDLPAPEFDGAIRQPTINRRDYRHMVHGGRAQHFEGSE